MFSVELVEETVLDEPVSADLDCVDDNSRGWLRLAVTFRLRGWDDAAATAYKRAIKQWNDVESDEDEVLAVSDLLRLWALAEWYDKLLARASDRGEVLNRLRELVREDPQLLTPHLQHTLRNLESTLVVRRSKPGSIEAMVDELTEHWEDTDTLERNDDAFWALAALGFDAVPVLIEHLTDERLTRTQFRGFNNFGPYIYRVNHFASRLLGELSGGRLINFEERGDSIDPGEALKWWGTVRQLSEENWLLDHVLPEPAKGSPSSPRKVILRAIRAKYPHRLREVYQAILLKRPDIDSERVVAEIAASVLPREHKIKLLEEGASHRDPAHRRDALVALAGLDGAAFRRPFVRAMQGLPETIPNPPEGQVSDVAFLWAMFAVEDRVC